MPLVPIRCTGRHYPNAPGAAKTGTAERGPPHFLQVRFFEGTEVWEPHNGEWLTCQWTGTAFTGWNPPGNWNWVDSPGISKNINISNGIFSIAFRFMVNITAFINFVGPYQNRFIPPFQPWFEWPPTVEFECEFHSAIGPNRLIFDDFITMRIGTYDRIPPDSCLQ